MGVADATGAPSFSFATSSSISWWKGLKVFDDDGNQVCFLGLQDNNHGPQSCALAAGAAHGLLFGYRIELWKAKLFGRWTKVKTLDASYFGPLLGKQVAFTWVSD